MRRPASRVIPGIFQQVAAHRHITCAITAQPQLDSGPPLRIHAIVSYAYIKVVLIDAYKSIID